MQVRSLGQEDPLEEGMTTHSSILAWRTRTEEPGGLRSQSWTRPQGLSMHTPLCVAERAPWVSVVDYVYLIFKLISYFLGCAGSLPCCTRASLCGGLSCCRACAFGLRSSALAVPGLSSSEVCGIFLNQRLNPCIGRWVLNHWTTREVPV